MKLVLFSLLFLSMFNMGEIQAQQNGSNDEAIIATIKEDTQLYESASTRSSVLYDIRNGNTVKVLEKGSEFSKIKFLKLIGYVATSKLNIETKYASVSQETSSSNSNSTSQANNSSSYTSPSSTNKTSRSSSSTSTSSSSSSYSSTCGARTKKGGSCRRTVSGGGYCWQHR